MQPSDHRQPQATNLGETPIHEEDEDQLTDLRQPFTYDDAFTPSLISPTRQKSSSVSFADETSTIPSSPKVPAAGAGTRTGPRPVPRSSSSLRHVQNKSRTSSFGTPLPEDRDPSEVYIPTDPTDSAIARQVDLHRRRNGLDLHDQADLDDSDQEDLARAETSKHWSTQDDYFSRGNSSERNSKPKSQHRDATNGLGNLSSMDEHSDVSDDPHDENDHLGALRSTFSNRSSLHAPSKASLSGSKYLAPSAALASASGTLFSPDDPSMPMVTTPGPVFPSDLNTPAELTPVDPPILDVRQRLEWQTMLASVLNSEVLKSESQRINSVDTPDLTKEQLAYQRWLDIRATLRGRGLHRGAIEEEEKRLLEGWAKMLRDLVEEVKACRAKQIRAAEESEARQAKRTAEAVDEAVTAAAAAQASSPEQVKTNTNVAVLEDADAEKQIVLEQIGGLLDRIDSAEEQFPSSKGIIKVVPEWGDPDIQAKLDDLYSWYNITTSLRLQINILRKWTGSETLEIAEHRHRGGPDQHNESDHRNHYQAAGGQQDVDDGTFVERIQKEGSLQSTFEKRTLSSLYQLIAKAKDTILERHESFRRMALPSFEPELVTLINFPTRLMQGALKLRLDYAGKLSEPSVLIVDSLTDDLRTALAMACRVKLQYTKIIVPIPERGWDLASCIAEGYDDVLRDALKFFFRLLRMKLKASSVFKETEILEPEWRFLSTAVESIEGGDTIVASNITQFVNKLFKRISRYFNRELAATFSRGDGLTRRLPGTVGAVSLAGGGDKPGGKAKNLVTLEERAKWIHSVFDNVRIRSRKLLGFARDIRNRLDNAAEYDLASLRPASDAAVEQGVVRSPDEADPAQYAQMDLSEFMQTLIDNDYFLVYTESLEENGIYLVAEPSLQDKPEVIGEMLCKCLHPVRPKDEETAMAAEANANALNPDADGNPDTEDTTGQWVGPKEQNDETGSNDSDDDEWPRYLLLLSPRDPFMWTGKVMHHVMPKLDISMADRRLRLVADGPKSRLELCKRHFQTIFPGAEAARAESSRSQQRQQQAQGADYSNDDGNGSFPLDILNEHMAHMGRIQSGLEDINKGVYLLSDTIIRKVPEIRRRLRGMSSTHVPSNAGVGSTSASDTGSAGGNCDELIQNCYSMAAEQGRRALPFIESVRLRNQMTLALGRLAIDWVAFICDDCIPSERKTFKWAVLALKNANYITSSENIFRLSEADFGLLRSKVASCMALLISHFDILGARSSVAKAQAEQERLEREQAERDRIAESTLGPADELQLQIHGADKQGRELSLSMRAGLGVQTRFNKLDTTMQATEDRWVSKMLEWDQARHEVESEQRLVGRVLDDTRLEDRSLQFLAQSASKVTIRWQQGQFIGGGTFGTVYLAFNLDSGGLMAVKEIRLQDSGSTPGLYKQIKDEMQVMSMLSHPNIVEYYGIEVHRDRVYIFEEYCQGGSLAALLEHGRIEDELVMQVYTLQMLDGLVYLHSKGVVHRDIKPDNILLDHMGVIKFVDFGAAKVLAKNSTTIQRSRRSGVVGPGLGGGMLGPDGKPTGAAAAMKSIQGTPMYMSPEVIKGENRGRRGAMDIWSLGCVVLEFATGKRPWSQLDNEWAIMFHIGMAQQPPPLPDSSQLSELGIDFIRQCLNIDPYERPSAAEMREHAWIRNFVDELNAANAAEMELDASAGGGGGGGGVEEGQQPMSTTVASTVFSAPTDINSSAAGVAAAAGLRSLSGDYRSVVSSLSSASGAAASMSLAAQQAFRRQQQLQQATQQATQPALVQQDEEEEEEEEEEKEESTGPSVGQVEARPPSVPGHPNHAHPGYSATIADIQYRREDEERRQMLRNDSELDSQEGGTNV